MQLTRLQWPGGTVLWRSKREREGLAIGTPARSERKGAADGAGWLGRYAVGSGRERGPHNAEVLIRHAGVLVDEVLSMPREDRSLVP